MYEEWASTLKTTKDEQYWQHVYEYAQYIVSDLEVMKAYKVAEKLNIPSNTLSYIKPLVYAIAANTSNTSEA